MKSEKYISIFESIANDIELTRKRNPRNFKLGIVYSSLGLLAFIFIWFEPSMISTFITQLPKEDSWMSQVFVIVSVMAMVMLFWMGISTLINYKRDE